MSAVIGALRVTLGIDAAEFETELKKANSTLDTFGKVAAGAAAALAAGFAAGVGAAISRIETMNVSMRKLDQAMKNSGNTARTSAKEVKAWADDLERATGRAAQEVLDVGANLASFGFGEDVFFRAIELANDMAAAWGGDLRNNLEGLSRALENPKKGLAMLSARGITFSEEGRKMAERLAEIGKKSEAAAILMDELEGQVKGVAEAGFQGLTASMAKAQTAMDGFFESVVEEGGIGEVIARGFDAAAAGFEFLTENFNNIVKVATVAGTTMALAFSGQILTATLALATAIGTHLVNAVNALTMAMARNPLGALAVALATAATALTVFRDDIHLVSGEVATLGDYMRAAWETIGGTISAVAETISGYLGAIYEKMAEVFGPSTAGQIASFFEQFAGIAKNVVNLVISHFKFGAAAIVTVFQRLPAMVGEAVVGIAQGVLKVVEMMVNGAIATINAGVRLLNNIPGVNLGEVGSVNVASKVSNPFAGAGSGTLEGLQSSGREIYGTDHLGGLADGLASIRDRANEIGATREAIEEAANSVRGFGSALDGALGGGEDTGSGSGGGGGGGGKGGGKGGKGGRLEKEREYLEKSLEQFRASLRTREEEELFSFEKRKAQIAEFEAQGLITAQEAAAMREALEQQHQDKMNEIRQRGLNQAQNSYASAAKGMAGALQTITGTINREGDKQVGIQKAISAAIALINTYEGISKALTLQWPMNLVAAAQVAAQGFAAVAGINSTSRGSGGGRRAAAGGSGGAAAAAPPSPARATQITLNGDTFGREQVRSLVEQLHEYQRDGGRLVIA